MKKTQVRLICSGVLLPLSQILTGFQSGRQMFFKITFLLIFCYGQLVANTVNDESPLVSIQAFNVKPGNSAAVNTVNLQKAIDWATGKGASLYVEPSDEPYPLDGGITLKKNVSLVGVHGPTARGTRHPSKKQPVGSVFKITDKKKVFITVESATQIKGIQFWYSEQTIDDPKAIIPYPATIQTSQTSSTQGVYLSCLTFYGEYVAMDFIANANNICESMIFEHCYGYPLSGEFIKIDYCYDIPRLLHCHINPANQRFIGGGYSRAVIDAVIDKKTFAYAINHTDNAQLIDVFTFGTYGGILLGEESYGQLTNFNFDCVVTGIYKKGSNNKNRNWQISQGSIIANAGKTVFNIHPIIITGQGHTAITNVEAFSGDNGALTNVAKSQDFLLIEGDKKLTVTLTGCRMRDYVADQPITIKNSKAVVQAVACIDKNENLFNIIIGK
ncbi:MAG: hypothetical protein ACOH2A_12095 [Sphingobacteriaceae bacterium]